MTGRYTRSMWLVVTVGMLAPQLGGCCCAPGCRPDIVSGWSCTTPPPCDGRCAPLERCVDNACTDRCESDADCSPERIGARCIAGRCGLCASDAECDGAELCRERRCVPPPPPDAGRFDGWSATECPPGGVRDVDVAYGAACAVGCDGRVLCWGEGVVPGASAPDCGGSCFSRPTEVLLPAGVAPVQVAVGDGFACALRGDGEVDCWGRLGPLVLSVPEPLTFEGDGLLEAAEIHAGRQHLCARELLAAQHVDCIGANAVGQLANRTTDDAASATWARVVWTEALALGPDRTFVLTLEGTVDGAGDNAGAQIRAPASLAEPATVAAPTLPAMATALAPTSEQTCVLLEAGEIACWGRASALLGADPPAEATPCLAGSGTCTGAPRVIPSDTTFEGLAGDRAGAAVVAWTRDGTAHGVGEADPSLLGPGGPAYEPRVLVALRARTTHDVAIGAEAACAILDTTRALVCWGRNERGQLGRGYTSLAGERPEDGIAQPPLW